MTRAVWKDCKGDSQYYIPGLAGATYFEMTQWLIHMVVPSFAYVLWSAKITTKKKEKWTY